jgi:hypothetical protein
MALPPNQICITKIYEEVIMVLVGHTHRESGDLINLLSFLENMLKTETLIPFCGFES